MYINPDYNKFGRLLGMSHIYFRIIGLDYTSMSNLCNSIHLIHKQIVSELK